MLHSRNWATFVVDTLNYISLENSFMLLGKLSLLQIAKFWAKNQDIWSHLFQVSICPDVSFPKGRLYHSQPADGRKQKNKWYQSQKLVIKRITR